MHANLAPSFASFFLTIFFQFFLLLHFLFFYHNGFRIQGWTERRRLFAYQGGQTFLDKKVVPIGLASRMETTRMI